MIPTEDDGKPPCPLKVRNFYHYKAGVGANTNPRPSFLGVRASILVLIRRMSKPVSKKFRHMQVLK